MGQKRGHYSWVEVMGHYYWLEEGGRQYCWLRGVGGGKREGISASYRTREGITPAVNFTKITGLSGSFQSPTMCALSCHLLYLNGAIFIT